LAGPGADMSFDLAKLAEQAMEMQKEAQRLQEEAAQETVTATAGGGMVSVVATGAGEIKEIRIDPSVIDPADPELLGDIVAAGVNPDRGEGARSLLPRVRQPDRGGALRDLHRHPA
jgi:nucleoid-associated protein EbfC